MELHAQLRVTALSHEPTTLSLKGRSIFYVVKMAAISMAKGFNRVKSYTVKNTFRLSSDLKALMYIRFIR